MREWGSSEAKPDRRRPLGAGESFVIGDPKAGGARGIVDDSIAASLVLQEVPCCFPIVLQAGVCVPIPDSHRREDGEQAKGDHGRRWSWELCDAYRRK